MTNTLSLYASKKLSPFLGKPFTQELPTVDPNTIHPLYCWYADVYYYKRKKYLIFCNEISRFTWMMGPFSADKKQGFMENFQAQLRINLKAVIPNTKLYFEQLQSLGKISQVHRGAVAHLNQMKSSMTQSNTQRYAPIDRGMLAKIPSRFSGQVVAIKNQIINT
ncbi:MAG: DUF6933 domain-containing protein [Bacteroidota bacterium]